MPHAIVVGAGHNGLVAATLLARHGIAVTILEEKSVVGGAAKTEYPFQKAPRLATSTGAYLLGLMPPELIATLGARLTLIRRDPHYFLPTLDRRYLLFGSNRAALGRQFREFFTEDDWQASQALTGEIAQIRDDIAPSWLTEPCSPEETAERYVRPALRRVFLDLISRPVEEYLGRFGFKSELVVAMYAVTDGFSGLHAGFGMPGTGMNFLVHNMCRLPGADGTWMIVKGGMGAVSDELARLATAAGATIRTGVGVDRVRLQSGRVAGVTTSDREDLDADIVVSNADPFRTRDLIGVDRFSAEFNARLDGFRRSGTTLKVNLALDRLPRFTCLPDDCGQHGATVHLLPPGPRVIEQLRRSFAQAEAGELPEFPGIEWYTHTHVDPSLRDESGRHSAAFFVQWVPHTLTRSDWASEESRYVDHLIGLADRFAPGFRESVVDVFTLTPPGIEAHFGITGGHIHHVDNSFGFDRRVPYAMPIEGLYACGAGCHPAGSVIGAAGHNAARRILRDLES